MIDSLIDAVCCAVLCCAVKFDSACHATANSTTVTVNKKTFVDEYKNSVVVLLTYFYYDTSVCFLRIQVDIENSFMPYTSSCACFYLLYFNDFDYFTIRMTAIKQSKNNQRTMMRDKCYNLFKKKRNELRVER